MLPSRGRASRVALGRTLSAPTRVDKDGLDTFRAGDTLRQRTTFPFRRTTTMTRLLPVLAALVLAAPIATDAQTPATPAPAAPAPATPPPATPAPATQPPAAAAPAESKPSSSEAAAIEDGSTVQLEYTLTDDAGAVLDSNKGQTPLTYTHGGQQIIGGLEKQLTGMHPGDVKKVTLKPDEAYGPVDPSAETEVPKESVPPDALTVGSRLIARN